MSSPYQGTRPPRRQSSTGMPMKDDDDLSNSLNKLSLVTSVPDNSRAAPSSPLASKHGAPLRPPSRRSSSSPASRRAPSRSPSGRDSDAAAPNLLRKASMNSLHSANGITPRKVPSRRSSAENLLSPSSKSSPFGMPPPEEELAPTAESIAKDYFRTEMDVHHASTSAAATQAIVVLNDAVYGHRFSRPRTSRNALSTIVERPERIKASVLGISSAYVRLSGHYSDGPRPIHPKLDVRQVSRVPFRIRKTDRKLSLLSPAVTNVHGMRWMEELQQMCESAEARLAMGAKELQRPDVRRSPDQSKPVKLHEGDLYLCSESQNAMEGALGAVCEAIDIVFGPGPRRAFVGVRPPGHHCSADHPSGFCWVNNVHVGIAHAALNHGLTHTVIIDFDLHHGDGSQDITWKHNSRAVSAAKNAAPWKKTSIAYFSLHDINSYPCEMGDEEKVKNASLCIDNAHGQTIWNVHLQSWKTEDEFWKLYDEKYMVLLDKARVYLRNQAERLQATNQPPKAAIFFSAGFDASEWESAGMQRHQVNVPTEFYARLAQDVVKLAGEEGLYVDGRVVSVLEGGYSDRALCSGVMSHLSGLAGNQVTEEVAEAPSGLGLEMGQKIGMIQEEEPTKKDQQNISSTHAYDPRWWSSVELERLEALLLPPPPPANKPRKGDTPTYFSPTQASTAKVNEPLKMRRSLTGLHGQAMASRPPSPPPPEVPWTTAAHELTKLLIPSNRQVDSHKAEELNAEASKARRERQSNLVGAPAAPPTSGNPSKMALRGRKPKPLGEEDTTPRTPRRRVAAPPPASADKVMVRGTQSARRTSRRLSGASTVPPSTAESSPLQGATASRPSAQTARPGPPASTRTQSADQVPLKKTRMTPAKKEAVPKAPRSAKKPTATTKTRSRPGSSQGEAPKMKPGSVADEMENLTTGVRKIKLNIMTQAKREAREKARLESLQESTSQPLTSRGDASADAEIVSPTHVQPHPLEANFGTSKLSTPVREVPPSSGTITPEPGSLPLDSSPTVPSVAVQPSNDPTDVFIPYQPEGPDPVTLPQQEPLKWLAANSTATPAATPSPVKRQDNLFRYTSGIPFAPRGQDGTPQPDKGLTSSPDAAHPDVDQPSSMWDIPESPRKEP